LKCLCNKLLCLCVRHGIFSGLLPD